MAGKRGRRSALTPETQAEFCDRIRAGCSIPEAAEASGLRPMTVKGWITRGRGESGTKYAEFAATYEQARIDFESSDMDGDEFRRHLNRAVRKGSVQAMKLWHEIYGRKEEPDDSSSGSDPFGALDEADELAARRAKRTVSA